MTETDFFREIFSIPNLPKYQSMLKKIWFFIKPTLQFILPESLYNKFRRTTLILLANFGYTNSLRRLDLEIIKLFNEKKAGSFIEVGAADGIDQSNTYLLEKKLGWKGLLVEARKDEFLICKKIRKSSIVENYFLTSMHDKSKKSLIFDTGLSSKKVNIENLSSKNSKIEEIKNITLSNLLKFHSIKHIDILCLDVEGYEIEVLEGYDNNSNVIKYLLVESWDFIKFQTYANSKKWEFIKHFGKDDYLFKLN